MKIELLYFEDCPSFKTAAVLLSEALSAAGRSDPIELIEIKDEADVQRWKFIGSPTIRFGGIDPFDQGTSNFGLECRVFNTPEGLIGWPTKQMLIDAIKLSTRY
ncbi:MAG TPA: hypothetical protein VFF70_06875 [Anaerolineae bacterium]|nr:hypothetical protein [Anaerolineae bacterium]